MTTHTKHELQYKSVPTRSNTCYLTPPEYGRNKANIFSYITWSWVSDIIKLGKQRPLTLSDIDQIAPNHSAKILLSKFLSAWDTETQTDSNPSLIRALYHTLSLYKFWSPILSTIFGYFVMILIAIFLRYILLFIEGDTTINNYIAYYCCGGLSICTLWIAIHGNWLWFASISNGIDIRVALTSAVIHKSLKISSNAIDSSKIINLLTCDIQRFEETLRIIVPTLFPPFFIILTFIYFSYILHNWWIMVGLVLFVILIPMQLCFGLRFGKYKDQTMLYTDQRLKIINVCKPILSTMGKNNDNNNNNNSSDNDMNNRKKKRKNIRRNFSYEYSLEQVLKKGNGISVINDYLCTFNDTGSSSSYNSNYSASTITSIGNKSTRSMQSIGNKSIKSTRSALNMRIYQQKHKQSNRNASGNIDKILQHMLIENDQNINGNNNKELATLNEDKSNNIANLKDIHIDTTDEQKENPKYREYLNLYLIVRDRVCNAKVLSFNGETQIYKPFKWMNEQLLKLKKSQLKQQKGKKEEKKQDDDDSKQDPYNNLLPIRNKCDDSIPSNVYRLLGVGILRTFLPSAILGGHLIDTTPLIDSEELETCMNSLLPLREKVLNIFQKSFQTSNKISLQRWFQPNRDQILNYNSKYAAIWVENFQYCLNVIFNEKVKPIVKSQAIALITPLKMLSEIENNKAISNQLFKHGKTSLNKNDIYKWKIPKISHISQVLTAAYCGTLITLDLISKNNKLNIIAKCLSKINKFEFETVLAIEMLKNKDLNSKIFTLIDENGKVYQIENNYGHGAGHHHNTHLNNNLISKKKTLRLLSRICSILPMRPFIDGKKPWTSKLSHSLAAFNHIVTSYHNSIKNCIESSITWLYCQKPLNDIMITPIFLKELALSLKQLPPEPCIGVGVLISAFINNFQILNWNEISNTMNDKNKYELLKDQLDLLTKQFPVFTRIHFAIQCCMQFFYQICTLVKELGDNNILNQQVVVQFEDAYEYLRELGVWDAIYFMEIQHNKKH